MISGTGVPSFVHDLETCVGCHACTVACANENQLAPGTSWRQIVTFNEPRWPGLPVFHLSLACNHCRQAPCLHQCPARAISRDPRTHAVVIDDGACIGCRYCSWVCPYDAPRFDAGRGVMTKCTLCNHRLEVGLEPACVSLCPVGALRLGEHRDDRPRAVAGFPDRGIRPLIRFEPMRSRGSSAPTESAPRPADAWPPAGRARKISLRTEWTLALFTFVAIVVFGAWTGGLIRGVAVPAVPALLAGALAVAVSSLHLGRPGRAWRAASNWRTSWLSREVLSFSTFLGAVAVSAVVTPGDPRIAGLAAVAGLLCLFCIDRVYLAMARMPRSSFDSVEAVSSGAFLAGIFSGEPTLFLALGAMRVCAFAARVRGKWANARSRDRAGDLLRVIVGWVLPLAMWIGGGAWAGWPAVALVVAGEALDRMTFYDALEIVTPTLLMARDLESQVAAIRPGADAAPAGHTAGT